MIHQVFTVCDRAVGAFLKPFFVRSKGEAVRSFMEACKDAGHEFSRNAKDYELFFVGEFDDVSGMLVPMAEPECVMRAIDILPAGKD